MANQVLEWYGYPPHDSTVVAKLAASAKQCPFVKGDCTKVGGVCSVEVGTAQVPVCPKRLYFQEHRFLRRIAERAFGHLDLVRRLSDNEPLLVKGTQARAAAKSGSQVQIGVFGQGWDGEVRLPAAVVGGGRYSVDFTLIAVAPDGELLGLLPVEVQTIDTTGSYRPSIVSLEADRSLAASTFGMNWENVNKRIIPQLITKGLMLQGERLCHSGLYFVTPEPVFDRIMIRLGGAERFRTLPPQPGSITFIRNAYAPGSPSGGSVMPLVELEDITISTSDLSLAFISPQNLPPAGAFEESILQRLNR